MRQHCRRLVRERANCRICPIGELSREDKQPERNGASVSLSGESNADMSAVHFLAAGAGVEYERDDSDNQHRANKTKNTVGKSEWRQL